MNTHRHIHAHTSPTQNTQRHTRTHRVGGGGEGGRRHGGGVAEVEICLFDLLVGWLRGRVQVVMVCVHTYIGCVCSLVCVHPCAHASSVNICMHVNTCVRASMHVYASPSARSAFLSVNRRTAYLDGPEDGGEVRLLHAQAHQVLLLMYVFGWMGGMGWGVCVWCACMMACIHPSLHTRTLLPPWCTPPPLSPPNS